MSGGRLPPSNAFSVGQQQPYLNHDAGSHFQSSPSVGAFVQPEKKGLGQESQYTARVNSQAHSVPQEMNSALRGEEISNDRLSCNVTEAISCSFQMSISTLVFVTRYHYFPSVLRREVRLRESIKQEKLTQTDLFDFLTMASLVSSSRFR